MARRGFQDKFAAFLGGDLDIDNRVLMDIEAGDDVEVDVDETTTTAVGGGVAAGDDIDDSSVNTGHFSGIQNSGHGFVDAEDAVIGDGNTVIEGSSVGAFAQGGGDATNVAAGLANLGSGDLTNVVSHGSGQTVVGNFNETLGDVDVDLDDVSGNANLAIGDGNQQLANQANTTVVDQSFNDNSVNTYVEDNSVEDSFNTVGSFNEDNDVELTTVVDQSIEDSFNPEDSFDVEDNSVFELEQELEQLRIELDHADDNDLDVDFD